ncbi:LacI family DNA-binding transcriptional regulator [Streptacidiphilus monticola]
MAKIRMSDVAAAAGVSTATVSMVLNGGSNSRISAETQRRVREAAEAIGYAPNSVARSLRTRKTHMVGLVSDSIATTPSPGACSRARTTWPATTATWSSSSTPRTTRRWSARRCRH